jgi:hypothetical protein
MPKIKTWTTTAALLAALAATPAATIAQPAGSAAAPPSASAGADGSAQGDSAARRRCTWYGGHRRCWRTYYNSAADQSSVSQP